MYVVNGYFLARLSTTTTVGCRYRHGTKPSLTASCTEHAWEKDATVSDVSTDGPGSDHKDDTEEIKLEIDVGVGIPTEFTRDVDDGSRDRNPGGA